MNNLPIHPSTIWLWASIVLQVGLSSTAYAQTTAKVKQLEQDTDAKSNIASGQKDFGLTAIPMPSKKEPYSEKYYESWVSAIIEEEQGLRDPELSRTLRTMHHWNRFLYYFKILPDRSKDILAAFMDAYRHDKHAFCAEYSEWIPRLTDGSCKHSLDYFQIEKPLMDEIVRLVLDSYDKDLVKQLKEIQKRDQSLRGALEAVKLKGDDLKAMLAKQRVIDLENLEIIESIIGRHGYPGRSLVGIENEEAAFLVIQHCGGDVIGEYLPIIKTAIAKNNLKPSVYPYLLDRYELSQGRSQQFGTQKKLESNEYFPIADPENVNQRRKKYGLRSIKIVK